MDKEIDQILIRLLRAERVVFLTGAGVSAESGVPTFRGSQGLWKSFRPEDLATPKAFADDPCLVWEWYDWRRQLISKCQPNSGHQALAAALSQHPQWAVITQNIDDLHNQAACSHGADKKQVIELHGNIFRVKCTQCQIVTDHQSSIDFSTYKNLPHCSECQSLLRPDVVWFGESLDLKVLEDSFHLADTADLFFVVGTSSIVQPAINLVESAHSQGALVIEINPEKTPLTGLVHWSLREKSGDLLPRILNHPY